MTNNAIDLIASPPAAAVDYCLRVANDAHYFGWWFIVLALIAIGLQLVQTLVAIIWPRLRRDGGTESVVDKGWLEALKGVLEALVKLPGWVAIFLAGFALLWLALEAPEKCTPKDKGAASQPQKPAPPPRLAPPTTTNQG